MKRRKVLFIIITMIMVFSTTGFSFAMDEELSVENEFTVEQEVNAEEAIDTEKEVKVEEEVKIEPVQTKSTEVKKSSAKAETKADPIELSITFKYIDRNTKEWTEYVITDSHDNRTIGIAKANNVIANHKTVTDGLVVKTFTGWDTEFPVVLNQSNPTVVVTAQYNIVKKPQLTFKYTDNISTGSGSWQNQSPTQSYTHTFKNPLVASPRTNYTFLYWENVNDSSERYTAGQKYKCNSSNLTGDTTVEFVAVYEYQPEVKVLYHFKNGLKDTGTKSKAIDIYADPQAPKSIKHWFYDEEGGNPIQKGELVALPEKLTPITTEPAAEDKVKIVNVYAHYHGVTFVDEDGQTVLKDRTEYQYNTDAADIEKPDDPTKEATAQYTFFFDGWFPTIINVIDEAVYQATYRSEVNKYTVTWENYDGAILEIDNGVPYGNMPVYNGATPTKPRTPQFSYEFTGWTPEVSEVTGDITYIAQFKEVVNTYTITWVNYDGQILETDLEVPYGDMPSYDGLTPEKPATSEYTYEFTNWTPEVSEVTEDMVYQATFNETLIPVPPQPTPTPTPDPEPTPVPTPTPEPEESDTTIIWVPGENIGMGDGIAYVFAPTRVPEAKAKVSTPATPHAAPAQIGAWALINLLIVIANCLIAIFMLVMIFFNKRKEDEETEVKNKVFGRICTLIIAIISGIIFLFTEDMSLPMVLVDKWTILMICTFIVQLIVSFISRHKECDKEDK